MSNSFTIKDIRRIRVEDYERTKALTPKELVEKTNAEAKAIWDSFMEARRIRIAVAQTAKHF